MRKDSSCFITEQPHSSKTARYNRVQQRKLTTCVKRNRFEPVFSYVLVTIRHSIPIQSRKFTARNPIYYIRARSEPDGFARGCVAGQKRQIIKNLVEKYYRIESIINLIILFQTPLENAQIKKTLCCYYRGYNATVTEILLPLTDKFMKVIESLFLEISSDLFLQTGKAPTIIFWLLIYYCWIRN